MLNDVHKSKPDMLSSHNTNVMSVHIELSTTCDSLQRDDPELCLIWGVWGVLEIFDCLGGISPFLNVLAAWLPCVLRGVSTGRKFKNSNVGEFWKFVKTFEFSLVHTHV